MNKIFKSKKHSKLESDNRYKLIPPESVLSRMNFKQGDTFIDIGTGTGYFAIPALEKITAKGRVIGTDISSDMLDVFRQKLSILPKNLELIQTDGDRIELPNSSADKILLAFLFHEIHERPVFIAELKRLMKMDGELTIVDWALESSEQGPPLHHRIGQEELISIFKKEGFTLLEKIELNNQHYLVRFKLIS